MKNFFVIVIKSIFYRGFTPFFIIFDKYWCHICCKIVFFSIDFYSLLILVLSLFRLFFLVVFNLYLFKRINSLENSIIITPARRSEWLPR